MKNDEPNLYKKTAEYYDYDSRDNLTSDIPFYLEYSEKVGGGVLELGCGTGRVSIPLAEAGFSITGLDLSDSMLDVFERKLTDVSDGIRKRIILVKGDMSRFSLGSRFNLIIAPFRAFQALTEDNDVFNCLKCVREHLSEEGLFIVNVFRPYDVMDENWIYPETVQWEVTDRDSGVKIVKKHWGSRIDVERQVIYPNYAFEIYKGDGKAERIEQSLSLKYYYYQQLKDCLETNGLKVIEEFGWYDKSNIENGRELIFVCRRSDF